MSEYIRDLSDSNDLRSYPSLLPWLLDPARSLFDRAANPSWEIVRLLLAESTDDTRLCAQKLMQAGEYNACRYVISTLEPDERTRVALELTHSERLHEDQLHALGRRLDRLLTTARLNGRLPEELTPVSSALLVAWMDEHPGRVGPALYWANAICDKLEHALTSFREELVKRVEDLRRSPVPDSLRGEILEACSAVTQLVADGDLDSAQSRLDRLFGVVSSPYAGAFRAAVEQADGRKYRASTSRLEAARWEKRCSPKDLLAYCDRTAPSTDDIPLNTDMPRREEAREFFRAWAQHRTRSMKLLRFIHDRFAGWIGLRVTAPQETGVQGAVLRASAKLKVPLRWVVALRVDSPFDLIVGKNPGDAALDDLRGLNPSGVAVLLYAGIASARSRELARQRRVALVDDLDLLRLLLSREPERAFAEIVAPQLPEHVSNPYRVRHGAAFQEMFVGRDAERTRLQQPGGAAVVFSGRCLGKTSLLRTVREEFHSPEDGRVAIFRSISTVGAAERPASGPPCAELFTVIAEALDEVGFSIGRPTDIESFKSAIRRLLSSQPTHRFLILLDEANDFALAEQHYPSKGVSWALRDLQFEAQHRISFVFAGYQYLHRACRERSLAFSNWSPIESLSVLPEDAARELVVAPMASLGIRFERPALVQRVLDFTGRHPRLLQEFCFRLVRRVHEAGRASEVLAVEQGLIDSMCADQEFQHEIRHLLLLNLEDDPRLRLIVLQLVSEATRGGVVQLERFTLAGLRDALSSVEGLQESRVPSEAELRLLLDDLKALGLVEALAEGWRLANRQHARILREAGEFEDLRARAIREVSEPTSTGPVQRRLACVADSDLERLQQDLDRHYVVIGLPESGRTELLGLLRPPSAPGILEDQIVVDLGGVKEAKAALKVLANAAGVAAPTVDALFESLRQKGVRQVVLDNADAPALAVFLSDLADKFQAARVRVVATGGANLALAWASELFLQFEQVSMRRLAPEHLRIWLRQREIRVGNKVEHSLYTATGGRLGYLMQFVDFLTKRMPDTPDPVPTQHDVQEFTRHVQAANQADRLLGPLSNECRQVARSIVRAAKEFSVSELRVQDLSVVEGFSAVHVQEIVDALAVLDLLRKEGDLILVDVDHDPLLEALA